MRRGIALKGLKRKRLRQRQPTETVVPKKPMLITISGPSAGHCTITSIKVGDTHYSVEAIQLNSHDTLQVSVVP